MWAATCAAQRETLSRQEAFERAAVVAVWHGAFSLVRSSAQAERKVLMAARLAFSRARAKERESHEQAEHDARMSIKREETKLRSDYVRIAQETALQIEQREEEKKQQRQEELERERRREAARKAEAERLAFEQSQQQKKQESVARREALQRENVERTEAVQRERSVGTEERKSYGALLDEYKILKQELLRWGKQRARIAARAAASTVPTVLQTNSSGGSIQLHFASRSMTGVRVFPPRVSLQVTCVKPPFMEETKTLLEPLEITNEEWLRQKLLFISGKIFLHLDNPVPGDAFVYDNRFHVLDPTLRIRNLDGTVLGSVIKEPLPPPAEGNRSEPDPFFILGEHCEISIARIDGEASGGLLPILRSLALFRRDSVSYTPLSGTVVMEYVTAVPLERAMLATEVPQAVVTSRWECPFVMTIARPILASSSVLMSLTYTPGQGDAILLAKLEKLSLPAGIETAEGAVVTVDLGPRVDVADCIVGGLHSNVRIAPSGATMGAAAIASLDSNRPGLVEGCGKERRLQEPTATDFTFKPGCNAAVLEMFLRALCFRNDCESPRADCRTIKVEVAFPSAELAASILVFVRIVYVAPPITIKFANNVKLPFRVPVVAPESNLAFLAQVVGLRFAKHTYTVKGELSQIIVKGYLSIRVVDEKSGDAIFFLSDAAGSASDVSVQKGVVVYKGCRVGSPCHAEYASWAFIQLEETTLDAALQVLYAATYTAADIYTVTMIPSQSKTVEVVLSTDGATPVRALCSLRVTQPLIRPAPNTTKMIFKQGSGPQRLGVVDVFEDAREQLGGRLHCRRNCCWAHTRGRHLACGR